MKNKKFLPVVTESELDKTGGNSVLNKDQLKYLLQETPTEHVYSRPAKGGGQWTYVTGTYVKKVLNLMFGWDWDFEIVEYKFDLAVKQAFVLGKLTVRTGGREITKMQFGRVDIKFRTEWNPDTKKKIPTDEPLDIGNDLKAAATDALKKCASELGIASDVYAKDEFKAIDIIGDEPEDQKQKIQMLLETEGLNLAADDLMYIERILDEEEIASYGKVIKKLNYQLKKLN